MREGLQKRQKGSVRDGELKLALDRLYESFNYADSATDPIQIVRRWQAPEDREIVGLCAAALAFGRVSSVLQSIERLLAVMGGQPAAYVRQFDPERDGAAFAGLGHRWTRGPDLVALVWIMRQMIDRAGSIESFFLEGDDPAAEDVETALDSFSTRALALDLRSAYGRVPRRPGVCYFFPRPSAGSGCKRLNLFLRWMVRRDALDLGVWTRCVAGEAGRAARHARHSRRPVPAADALHQPGMAHGARHHRLAAAARRGGSGQVRLRDVPPRDDERVRIQSRPGGHPVSAAGSLPAAP